MLLDRLAKRLLGRLHSIQAFLIGFACTFFRFLDIPVFWPILLVYFFILFGTASLVNVQLTRASKTKIAVTMRKQIRHMIKYKYLPFSFGKKVYKGKGPANSK